MIWYHDTMLSHLQLLSVSQWHSQVTAEWILEYLGSVVDQAKHNFHFHADSLDKVESIILICYAKLSWLVNWQ